MAELTDDEIRDAILILKQKVARVGAGHAWWDIIFDAEAMLKGERTLRTRAQIIELIEGALKVE